MAEAARADWLNRLAVSRLLDVIDDIVRTIGITAYAKHTQQMIKLENITHSPRDHMVRAGRVTTDAQPALHDFTAAIEGQTAAEDVDATDSLVFHWVVR